MNLCVLTTRHPPDDDRIYYKQVQSLVAHYGSATLVAPGVAPDPARWDPRVTFRGLPVRSGLPGRLLALVDALRVVRRLAPDVVHFHDLDLVLAVPLLRLLSRARLVYDVHEAYPQAALISERIPRRLRPVVAAVIDVVEKGLARLCDLLVTADDPTRDSFDRCGVDAVTVFNFPRLELFRGDDARLESLRRHYGGRLPLVYQGSMAAERGLFHMIRAIRPLRDADPRYVLVLIGLRNAALRERAEALIRELDVAANVEIHAWVPHDEIVDHLRAAHLGLVPLQPNEKFKRNIPIKIFEYMACGLPMLAADLPPIATFVREAGAGVLFDSASVDALVQGVRRLTADAEGRARMGEAGRRAVQQHWNWQRMEQRLLAAYVRLEAPRGRR